MFKLLFILLTIVNNQALAAGKGPPDFVHWQAINLIILFSILFFLLKNQTKEFFKNRRLQYVEAKNKAQKAREDAEKAREDIKLKLFKIENSRKEMIENAEKQALEEYEKIVLNAQSKAEMFRKNSEIQMNVEVERAKSDLLKDLVNKSVDLSKTNLKTAVKEEEKSKLQKQFIKEIQVVNHV